VDDADYDRGLARPPHPSPGRVNRAPFMQIQRSPVERVSPCAMVLGGDEAEGAVSPQQVERPAEEVRDEVGVPCASG